MTDVCVRVCASNGATVQQGQVRPAVVSREISPRLRSLMERCWLTDPQDRPSFATILEELTHELEGEPSPASPYRIDLVAPSCGPMSGGTTVRLSGCFPEGSGGERLWVCVAGIPVQEVAQRSATELVVVTRPAPISCGSESFAGDCVARVGAEVITSPQMFTYLTEEKED